MNYLTIQVGRYAGQPLDDSSRRSIQLQSQSERQAASIEPGIPCAVVSNFYHAGEFWIASIPLDAVRSVYAQSFNFSKPKTRRGPDGPEILYDSRGIPLRSVSGLNHIQSRFMVREDRPVELFRPDDRSRTQPVHSITDFIYSLEAVGPVGVHFNFRDALSGNLFSAHRFLSTQEMVFERISVENQYVMETPPLPLDGAQQRGVLVGSLLRSHKAGSNERYYLYRYCGTNNCTSNPLQIVDGVVNYSLARRFGALLYRLPLNPRLYLRIRGLDTDPTVRNLVREEFELYLADPATRQRKRDHVRRKTREIRAMRAESRG